MSFDTTRLHTEKPLLWLAIAVLMSAIFVADTVTELQIAVAVLYVVVVLISVQAGRPRAVILVGAVCAFLTIVSYLLSR